MCKLAFISIAAAIYILYVAAARQDAVNADIVFTNVDRKIDISTHLVKISSAITLENNGKSSVGYFLIAIEPILKESLSFVGAAVCLKNSLD